MLKYTLVPLNKAWLREAEQDPDIPYSRVGADRNVV